VSAGGSGNRGGGRKRRPAATGIFKLPAKQVPAARLGTQALTAWRVASWRARMGLLAELELLEGRGLLGPEVASAVLSLGTQLHQGLVHSAHGVLLEGQEGVGRQEAGRAQGAWRSERQLLVSAAGLVVVVGRD
jgi:hypothetical protein